MVQNLNLIMITSPELADFRKRLRTLESKDGQTLFTILYRSWSHNAIATFSLCLLAQAYEQAYSLLQILSVPAPSRAAGSISLTSSLPQCGPRNHRRAPDPNRQARPAARIARLHLCAVPPPARRPTARADDRQPRQRSACSCSSQSATRSCSRPCTAS